MTIPHYGVWVGQPTHYTAQTDAEDPKSPHIYLYFKDDSSSRKQLEAAINVKSTDQDSRLVYWFDRSFTHAITEQLTNLDEGFHLLSTSSVHSRSRRRRSEEASAAGGLKGLDFVRTQGLVDIHAGAVLGADGDQDILDKVDPILTDAINQKATIYIFGSSYGSGIHDIHMNQGSAGYENGIYEDGALLFQFDDGHWEAVFLAFASQQIPTDDKGEPESDSQSLATILGQ
ncbi:YukJ family protein [Aspergillus saccharolyticus JOP 1030-1]|uniref:Uncharacterized protein n=1 Tax=Aspergillus saccharolyticus JOP 1030-1 TaxID=1450539 RepID=A0A318ZB09_9EURO|nr:hypothetical protein BP01DRAFT_357615 [Aspergillus saccharolyticus JOP 1030-1]PYH44621.1 hypothetical protein BP01DRAFT_357615 [Aspergillus saccharolyticus JOP 1030-1]